MARRNTRNEILDVAEELLLSRGYSAFSYADIAGALGIRKASVHHHFPRKEDLGLALVQRYRERSRRELDHVDSSPIGPVEKINLFIDAYLAILQKGSLICTVGILEAEFNVLPPRMQNEMKLMVTDRHNWLIKTLSDGRSLGQVRTGGGVENQASLIMAALQGGLQMARALGQDHFYGIRQQVQGAVLA